MILSWPSAQGNSSVQHIEDPVAHIDVTSSTTLASLPYPLGYCRPSAWGPSQSTGHLLT